MQPIETRPAAAVLADTPAAADTAAAKREVAVWTAGVTLVAALAGVKLILHLATTGLFGYSYFVDELYYLACSRHLAWGFVDMPPLFPALTALVRVTLGQGLFAVRLVPALAGAALVLMTGLMARDLGGRRLAMGLAALGVLTAPIWLVMHSIHTMNAIEQLLWTGCAWLVIRIARDDRQPLWLAVSALEAIGLLNKHSMVFFVAALSLGIVLTPERRALRSRWLWLGAALTTVLVLPNLVWEIQHHFPHLESLEVIRKSGRDVQLSSLEYLKEQWLMLNPLALPLWLGGLVWLLAGQQGRRYRILGIAFLAVIAEMLILHGRPYYPAPAYPMLFAAGGVAIEGWLAAHSGGLQARRRRWRGWQGWLAPAFAVVLVLSGAVLAPLAMPLLPPMALVHYSQAIGLAQPRIENHRLGPLPQLMADRFGWREMAGEVARVYHALPAADQRQAAIFGQNYGQAGAIDLFGPALGLPPAISGHLSYWLWGPRGYTGDVMIVLDDRRERLEQLFADVRLAGHVEHPYSMPYQHFDVYVCRRPRQSLAALWPQVKNYD